MGNVKSIKATPEYTPPPPLNGCESPTHDKSFENGSLHAYVEGKGWLCRRCFFTGPGARWPRPSRARSRRK